MSEPSPTSPLKDMKEGLSSARKPDITHVRVPFLNYTSRPCEYGSTKYVRANFLRPVAPGGYTGTPAPEDFERFRTYLRAAASHLFEVLDAMERHLSLDPNLLDVEGMKRAAYAVDTDVTPGARVGASLLPHVAPACSSLNMAITQAVECGLLPRDPGTPWRNAAADAVSTVYDADLDPAHYEAITLTYVQFIEAALEEARATMRPSIETARKRVEDLDNEIEFLFDTSAQDAAETMLRLAREASEGEEL